VLANISAVTTPCSMLHHLSPTPEDSSFGAPLACSQTDCVPLYNFVIFCLGVVQQAVLFIALTISKQHTLPAAVDSLVVLQTSAQRK